MHFGLIGKSLKHSFSERYFNVLFKKQGLINYKYSLYEIDNIEKIRSIFDHDSLLKGVNVTIPYKSSVIPYLDELSPVGHSIKAINCILNQNHKLIGHNTDAEAFEASLNQFIPPNFDSKALVLGTGGSSKAVCYILDKKNINYQLVSRNSPYFEYQNITKDILNQHKLIINTSPLGMFPDLTSAPNINYSWIGTEHFLFDLVYNPENSLFLRRGILQGSHIQNGLEMLYRQAQLSWDFWNHS